MWWLQKICISQTLFCNYVISFKSNNVPHMANKYILLSIRWMHQKMDIINAKCLNKTKNSNDQNLSECFSTPNVDEEFKNMTSQVFRSHKPNTDLYLVSPEVAKKFVILIKDDLLKNMSHVIELNPGFGYLTETLFQIGIPFVHLYGYRFNHQDCVNNVYKKFPDKFSFTEVNLFNVRNIMNAFCEENIHIYKLLNDNQYKKWEEESCMQVIGATTNFHFISHLITSTVFQTSFMMYGRPIFYIAIPPSICNRVTVSKLSKNNRIMFNTLFNYKVLGTVDRNAFLPKYKYNKDRSAKANNEDSKVLNVIKIEPKPELFKLFKTKKSLMYFWHFVRHNFYRPSSKVIPTLEQMVPGCGIKLIALNYNIFTKFNDLNHNQVYDIFMQLQSCSGYEQSPFTLSAEHDKEKYNIYLEHEEKEEGEEEDEEEEVVEEEEEEEVEEEEEE